MAKLLGTQKEFSVAKAHDQKQKSSLEGHGVDVLVLTVLYCAFAGSLDV